MTARLAPRVDCFYGGQSESEPPCVEGRAVNVRVIALEMAQQFGLVPLRGFGRRRGRRLGSARFTEREEQSWGWKAAWPEIGRAHV